LPTDAFRGLKIYHKCFLKFCPGPLGDGELKALPASSCIWGTACPLYGREGKGRERQREGDRGRKRKKGLKVKERKSENMRKLGLDQLCRKPSLNLIYATAARWLLSLDVLYTVSQKNVVLNFLR